MVPVSAVRAPIAAATLAMILLLAQGQAIAKKDKVEVTLDAPASGALYNALAAIELKATAYAKQRNHPIVKVEFFQSATKIGASTVPVAGHQYALNWTGVPAGTYMVTAKATNDKGDTDVSDPVRITVNAPPRVALTSPANNSLFQAPGTFNLSADAADTDGSIAKVDFYNGEALVGTATAAPYNIAVSGLTPGPYSFTAAATDDRGARSVSAPVAVSVNGAPSASIAEPPHGAVFLAPATLTVSASAADADGGIAKVDFYAGTALIGTATAMPFTIQWPNVASGIYSLTAIATDVHGASTTSPAVSIKVNAPPTLSLISPTNNATFSAPANITLTADVVDSDGSIAKVEFFSGTTLIATRSAAPYSIVWTGVPQGSYSLTARATDDLGAIVASTLVNVAVTAAAAQLYYIHVDHLNTPRLVANQDQQTVWRWDQAEPFGNNRPDENPSALGVFDLPLRLPGQYFDKESNVAYNFYRDFDSSSGRYIQSDPIGLVGGINTYVYVNSRPLDGNDFFGLQRTCGTGNIGARITPNLYFGPCCGEHDDCYDDCDYKPSKDSCDREFNNCTMRQCSSRWVTTKFACEYFAVVYATSMRGPTAQHAFDDARRTCTSCRP